MTSSSQSFGQKELTEAQLRRRKAVLVALSQQPAASQPSSSSSSSPTQLGAPSSRTPPSPTKVKAESDMLGKLSKSQLSLYKAGIYRIVAPKPVPTPAVPTPLKPPPPAPQAEDVKLVIQAKPKITPKAESLNWLNSGSEDEPIEVMSSDVEEEAAAGPSSRVVQTSNSSPASIESEPLLPPSPGDVREQKQREVRIKAEEGSKGKGKMARGGFDLVSLDDDRLEVKPTIASVPVKRKTRDAFDPESEEDIRPSTSAALPVPAKRPKTGEVFDTDSEEDVKPALNPELVAPPAKEPVIVLSAEQQKVLDMIVNDGTSLFFTGSAGTGKSVLLRALIQALRRKYRDDGAVAVTATTGIAACNIGGSTVHSFAGIGLGKDPVPVLVKKIRGLQAKSKLESWLKCKVWIIDELSMLDGILFDKLATLGSTLRGNNKPFGGIQMVVCGDFLQLPPVMENNADAVFAFESESWNKVISKSVNLTTVFRQKDQRFVDMLNEMRYGNPSWSTTQTFNRLTKEVVYEDGLEPTELFALRAQVEQSNKRRIDALHTEEMIFRSVDSGTMKPEFRQKLLDNMMAIPILTTKVGSQVMLIKNLTPQLVNGSIGTIIAYSDKRTYTTTMYGPRAAEPDHMLAGKGAKRRSVQEMRDAEMWGSDDEYGHENLRHDGDRLPLVRFRLMEGGTQDVLLGPENFKIEAPNGEVVAQRVQIPLILAWAMSIHKSQGQTLQRVKVDLGKVFEKGQSYVALSRATNLNALQVLNFRPEKVTCHPRVVAWSAKHLQNVS